MSSPMICLQAGEYIRTLKIGEGDAIGLCASTDGNLCIECNTAAVKEATVRPTFGAVEVQPLEAPPPEEAAPLISSNVDPGQCTRNPHCTKASGHSGLASRSSGMRSSCPGCLAGNVFTLSRTIRCAEQDVKVLLKSKATCRNERQLHV